MEIRHSWWVSFVDDEQLDQLDLDQFKLLADRGGFQKLVVPESVPANLPERRAAVVFQKWFARTGL
jgi:hypothetical protein